MQSEFNKGLIRICEKYHGSGDNKKTLLGSLHYLTCMVYQKFTKKIVRTAL